MARLRDDARANSRADASRMGLSSEFNPYFYVDPSDSITINLYPFMVLGQFLLDEGVPIGPRDVVALFSRFKALLESGVWGMLQVQGICIVIPCPAEIHWNEENQLHKDGGAALAWKDGFRIWSLNDVSVPQWLAVTPTANLHLDQFHRETNADIRAEFIRKYGVDRMAHLGVSIDSYKNHKDLNPLWIASEYELIDMGKTLFQTRTNMGFGGLGFPGIRGESRALYLKMKNLTVDGIYHLEGVSNSCRTIIDAVGDRWEEKPEDYESIAIK